MELKVSALPVQEVHRSLVNPLSKRFLSLEEEQACRTMR